jgi:translation initiation factor IF-2
VKQKPDEAVFLNNLAVVLLYRGRYDEALTHARRALKILPGSKDVQDTIRQIEKAQNADGAKKPETKPAPKKKSETKPPAKKKPEAKKPEAPKAAPKPAAKKPESPKKDAPKK